MKAVVVYLLVYAFTNLGAFAVVIAVSRTTRSGKISSFAGLINYAPGQAVLMTIFLASLAGIPPLGGWIAKFNVFRAVLDAGTTAAYVLAVIGAVNTAIAAAYYLRVMRTMWMDPPPEGAPAAVATPPPVMAALGITAVGHRRARRAPGSGDGLRRPPGPHRRLRQLIGLAQFTARRRDRARRDQVGRRARPRRRRSSSVSGSPPTIRRRPSMRCPGSSPRGSATDSSSSPSASGASDRSASIGSVPTTAMSRRHRSRGWRNTDVRGHFAERFDVPIGFDNDVNGAALAETRWGAAQGCAVAVYSDDRYGSRRRRRGRRPAGPRPRASRARSLARPATGGRRLRGCLPVPR